MRSFRLLCTLASLAAVFALFLLSATVVTIYIHNRVLRRQAEELLSNMQSINLRQTTFGDLQPFLQRWRRSGKYDGPCNQLRCVFNISLSALVQNPLNQFLFVHNDTFDFAARLGYHPTGVGARIIVLDGRVWGEAIFFGMETRGLYENGRPYRELVSGEAISVARTQVLHPGTHWEAHREYQISWPTNHQNEIRFSFTPFADPADVHRFMALDFSCLTRSTPCLDKRDIMPTALAQSTSLSSLPYPTDPECKNPEPFLLAQFGRDARHVVIAKIGTERTALSNQPASDVNERTLLLQKVLKAAKTSAEKVPASFWMFDFTEPAMRYREGDSVILFLKDDNFNGYSLEGCGPLAATENYLSIVNRGIAEDTRPSGLPDFATGVVSQ